MSLFRSSFVDASCKFDLPSTEIPVKTVENFALQDTELAVACRIECRSCRVQMNVSNLLLLLHEITKLFLIFCTFSSHHDDANAIACYYYLRLDISMLMRSTLLTFSMLLVLVLNPRVLDIVVPRLRYCSTRKIHSKRQLGSHVAC